MPPRPARIAGVEAMAAPISGAARPTSVPQAAGCEPGRVEHEIDRKQHDQQHDGEAELRPSDSEASDQRSCRPSEHGGDHRRRWSCASPEISRRDLVLAEHQHAVAEQQDLLDLARQHDQRHAVVRASPRNTS